MLNSVVYYIVRCCNLWTRLRVSYAALFDPGVSGFIGILPDSTAGLLRFKCVLTVIVVLMMVSALKPVYVGRGCHSLPLSSRLYLLLQAPCRIKNTH